MLTYISTVEIQPPHSILSSLQATIFITEFHSMFQNPANDEILMRPLPYPSGSPATGALPNPTMIAVTSTLTACAAAGSVPLATIATPLPVGR